MALRLDGSIEPLVTSTRKLARRRRRAAPIDAVHAAGHHEAGRVAAQLLDHFGSQRRHLVIFVHNS
jgi:hypothetical protein